MRAILLSIVSVFSLPAQSSDQFFFGGGVGMTFGDVDYFELSPLVGIHLSPQLSTGVSFLYRRRSDNRFTTKLVTEDYGANLFARYSIVPNVFVQGEIEHLSYEFYRPDLTKERDSFASYLLGGGIFQPISNNASFYTTILYNFSYDDDNSPYADPWVYRAGVGIGF